MEEQKSTEKQKLTEAEELTKEQELAGTEELTEENENIGEKNTKKVGKFWRDYFAAVALGAGVSSVVLGVYAAGRREKKRRADRKKEEQTSKCNDIFRTVEGSGYHKENKK
jgi:hypothetical protein